MKNYVSSLLSSITDNLNMIHSQLCGALKLTLVFLFHVFFIFVLVLIAAENLIMTLF